MVLPQAQGCRHRVMIGGVSSRFLGMVNERVDGIEVPGVEDKIDATAVPVITESRESGFVGAAARVDHTVGVDKMIIDERILVRICEDFVGLRVLSEIEVTGKNSRVFDIELVAHPANKFRGL